MPPRAPRPVPLGPVVALLAMLAHLAIPTAWASTFDEATGRLDISDAPFSISFDDLGSIPGGLPTNDEDGSMQPEAGVRMRFLEDPEGLEGTGAFAFGGDAILSSVDLAPLSGLFDGRRMEARIWQRPQGTRARFVILWCHGAPDDGVCLSEVVLLPTGRVTDDGWEEWSSGPVSYATVGGLAPSRFDIIEIQHENTEESDQLRHDSDARTLIDAFEVLDAGPVEVEPTRCTLATEADVCGDEGLCFLGHCAEASHAAGRVPPTDHGVRRDYVMRRASEYRAFEGGRIPQQRMAALEAAFEAAVEGPAGLFWATLHGGVEQLTDGHASTPSTRSIDLPLEVDLCLHLGEADLLPAEMGGRLPLVFETVGEDPLSEALRPGDALVEIDGLTVEDWRELAARYLHYGGDPAGFEVVTAHQLVRAAIRSGSVMTFARCDRTPPDVTPCTEDELERLTFDLYELISTPVLAGEPPGWLLDERPPCDYRFSRAMDDPEVREYGFAGHADHGSVRTLLINGVPWNGAEGAGGWGATVWRALATAPSQLILDQRKGRGGAISTTDFISAMLVAPGDLWSMELYPTGGSSLTEEELLEILGRCIRPQQFGCGGAWRWVLGEESDAGDRAGLAAGATLAILNTMDASGNDFTSQILAYRSSPTRIFAPAPTFGAFGPRYDMPGHIGEGWGGSVQGHDTIFIQYRDGEATPFLTGVGVPPDEVVIQLQSDAVLGIDTMVEAALAWLEEEAS